MNDIEQFADFFSGSLDAGAEQGFFEQLAADAALRAEFRAFAAITGAINSNRKAFAPSASLTESVFTAAGIPAAAIAGTSSAPASGFLLSKSFTIIATAIITLLVAVPASYFLFMPGGQSKGSAIYSLNKIAGNVPYISAYEIESAGSNNSIQDEKKNVVVKYIYIDRKESGKTEHEISSTKNNTTAMQESLLSNGKINYKPVNQAPRQFAPVQNTGQFIPVSGMLNEYYGGGTGFSAEIANNPAWTNPAAKISPDEFNRFNNISFAVYYTVNEKLKIGAEASQETFYTEYTGTDPDGSVYRIRQQPNLTTFTANARYSPFGESTFSPYVQIGLGGNKGGIVIKPSLGMEYQAYPGLSFVIGAEYNWLRYSHGENDYWAEKLDLRYGLLFKF